MSKTNNEVQPSIGFIGLGAMGSAMVARVANEGYSLSIHDTDYDRASGIALELGCNLAVNAAGVAETSDIIITMLPTSVIVAEVLSGKGGVLETLRKDALIVEMSSGVPAHTNELSKLVADHGASLVDAPVSGGVSKALTGELAIMFGGDDDAFNKCEKLLGAMGTSVLRTGDVGSAHTMKALNNLVSAGGFLIGIEALLIGSRYGIDPEVMVDVLNASTGMNNSTQKKFKQFVLSRKFDSGFSLELMAKDLGIAIGVAEETDTTAPFANLCRDLWAGGQNSLPPGQDHTAMAKFSEMLANSELHSDKK